MVKNIEETGETEVKETAVIKETEDIGPGYDMFMEVGSGGDVLTLDLQEAGSISYYKEKMEKKEKLEIRFSVIDRYDNLIAYAGGVTVKMLNNYIKGYRRISLIIGKADRSQEPDIDLSDCEYSSFIYFQHAVLNFTLDQWYIEDLESQNGVKVKKVEDGECYRVLHRPCKVAAGDILYIANTKLLLT